MNFLNLKPETFGLDISDLSLKIIKLKKRRNFLELASFGESKIKPGIIKEGEIKDVQALAKIIKEAIAKIQGEKLKTKYVIVSLPEEKAFLQVIQLPKMTEEEMQKAVKFEAENYIPLPINDVYVDFQIAKPIRNHLDHSDILLAALPQKTVDLYLETLKSAGLTPLALEIESLAVSRAMIKQGVSPFPVMLIDFGNTSTRFIIYSGYSLRFTSSVPVSYQKFTEVISRSLKMTPARAEKMKIKYGMDGTDKQEGKAVFRALLPQITDLLERIKNYLSYYQSHATHEHLTNGSHRVAKILLCGDGANLKNLFEFLAQELKIPVELGDPWVNILPKNPKEIPKIFFAESLGYTTVLGLALRSFEPKQ